MSDNIKLYSDIDRFEVINVNDGEKYNTISDNDIVIDECGNLKVMLLFKSKTKFNFFGSTEFIEVPWEYVKKIGSKTVIIDADDSLLKKTKI